MIKKMEYPDDHAWIESTRYWLISMAELISMYPSLLESQSQGDRSRSIHQIISMNIFAIMAEDVFISIVSDMDISVTVRESAGLLLTKIRENRIFPGVNDFAPILNELREKRKNFLPSFGTMAGVTEITGFCQKNNRLWISFFKDDEFNEDRLESLKEYLMGLTYEEILKIQPA